MLVFFIRQKMNLSCRSHYQPDSISIPLERNDCRVQKKGSLGVHRRSACSRASGNQLGRASTRFLYWELSQMGVHASRVCNSLDCQTTPRLVYSTCDVTYVQKRRSVRILYARNSRQYTIFLSPRGAKVLF